MANEPVKVYIYDLSKGMARTMSRAFLGKQIDGIWHTGIVVFGQEFYFGGLGGIESCPPGGLQMLGQPNEIVDLGTTEIPFEIFMDHLRELATTTFRGECYHLLDHNCNTFSNELAMFLTGRPIPSHITNLPQEVLSTPFGSMIRPMLDSMQVNPGGSQVFPNAHAGGAQVFPGNTASANTHSSSNAANTTATQGKNDYFPKTTYLSFDSAKIPNIIEKLKEFNKNVPGDLQEREILLEQLDTLAEGKESRIEQLNTLKKILKWPASFVFPALDLLRLSMRHVKINNHFCGIDNSSDFIELLKTHLSPSSPPANQMLCLRTMCNTFLHPSGETILMLNAATIIAALKESLLTRDKNTQVAACSVVLNYSVVCLKRNGTETSKLCLGVVNKIARESTNLDAEAAFRLLVAIGNFASVDKSVCEELGREVYGEIKRFVEARSKQKDSGKVYECAVLVLFKVC